VPTASNKRLRIMTDLDERGPNGRPETAARQALMRVCADATEDELETALAALGALPSYAELRAPQTGLVMLRGRIGGNGIAFNVGEAIVTRAAIQLESGTIGFSYLLGRSHRRAQLAALVDAMGQDSADSRARLEASLVAPVEARRTRELADGRAETAATKVNFFTLVRGED
jgi:alpha-D-ribose 1-methylphosphonate 5-triphosphate synthase subunit PhnG